jgi:hypothetical protein
MTRAPQDEAGGGEAETSASAEADAAAAAEAGTTNTEAGTNAAEADYSFLPDAFRENGANDVTGFRARFDELEAQDALRQEALAGVPEDGAGYEFTVPEDLDFGDLELPEGFGFQLKTDDPNMAPVFEKFGALLHQHNLPASAAADFMGVLAQYQAAEYSPLYAQSQAEMAQLGAGGEQRIADVERALTARLPQELAASLKASATSANGVKALEQLLKPRGMKSPPATPPAAKSQDDQLKDYYENPTN